MFCIRSSRRVDERIKRGAGYQQCGNEVIRELFHALGAAPRFHRVRFAVGWAQGLPGRDVKKFMCDVGRAPKPAFSPIDENDSEVPQVAGGSRNGAIQEPRTGLDEQDRNVKFAGGPLD